MVTERSEDHHMGGDLLEGADSFPKQTRQTSLPVLALPEAEGAPGFEPGDCGLEVPSGFLTPTPIRILALAVLVVLGLTGGLDTPVAHMLWHVFLP